MNVENAVCIDVEASDIFVGVSDKVNVFVAGVKVIVAARFEGVAVYVWRSDDKVAIYGFEGVGRA